MLIANFTGWYSQPMVDLYNYILQNDVTGMPDFIGEMIKEGKCRPQCHKDQDVPSPMNDEEKLLLKSREESYFKKNMIEMLRRIIPVNDVQIPVLDEIGQ